jgi:hypothetical protein
VSASGDLLARIGAPDRAEQRRACDEALERVRGDAELRDALRELLRGPSPLARFGATWVLFQSERPTLRLLPALLDALELADGDLRWQAAQMLAALGRLQPEVNSVLWHEAGSASVPARRRMALFRCASSRPSGPDRGGVPAGARRSRRRRARAALACFASWASRSAAAARARWRARRPDPRMARIAAVVLPELARHTPTARRDRARAGRSSAPPIRRSPARAARAQLAHRW